MKGKSAGVIKKNETLSCLILGLSLVLIVVVGGVSAYYISHKAKTNTFAVEHNESEIIEDFDEIDNVTPDTKYNKDVKVTNVDGVDCYVRVKVRYSDSAVEEYISTDLGAHGKWVYDSLDGYYYYIDVLGEGETTVSLMTYVKTSEKVTQEQINEIGTFSIYIEEETCQAADYDTYADAWAAMQKNK